MTFFFTKINILMSKNVSKAASSSMPLNESKGRWKKRRDFKKKNISSSHNKNHPFRIPEGWLDVAPFGKRVMNSPFLPFKVPLDSKFFSSSFAQDEKWMPEMIQGMKVDLIIDLTNTTKYYNANQFNKMNIDYHKMAIDGFSQVPSLLQVNQFKIFLVDIVDAYLQHTPLALIGIHCTHGLNRTGYMIIQYMMQKQLKLSITTALQQFETARAPGLIKAMYVEELYKQYGNSNEPIRYPVLPEWAIKKYSKRS